MSAVSNTSPVANLDAGEAEAIAQAKEVSTSHVLLDERAGCSVARLEETILKSARVSSRPRCSA